MPRGTLRAVALGLLGFPSMVGDQVQHLLRTGKNLLTIFIMNVLRQSTRRSFGPRPGSRLPEYRGYLALTEPAKEFGLGSITTQATHVPLFEIRGRQQLQNHLQASFQKSENSL